LRRSRSGQLAAAGLLELLELPEAPALLELLLELSDEPVLDALALEEDDDEPLRESLR
jgi:hypothetical protein